MTEPDNITIFDNNTSDLSSIYRQISVEPDMLFDVNEEKSYLVECIENAFEKNFLLIETTELLNNKDQINLTFVTLIKFCKTQQKPYHQIHKLFLEYCDYFNLPYNKCFILLHEKLQKIIKQSTMLMIGKAKYKKIDDIANPNKVFTLFDLVK